MSNGGDDLSWRVERTCHRAWPSLAEEVIGDWVLRFAAGHSRRANSANPLCAVGGDIGALIDAAETRYAAEDLPTIFRIPTLLPPGSWQNGEPRMDAVPALGQHTDAILSRYGYSAEAIAALRDQGVV